MKDMHTAPVHAKDVWILRENVVYNFQQSQVTHRLPHLRQQAFRASTGRYDVQPASAPDIVLLSLWPQATEQQILHYSVGYRTLYPTAKVVRLHNSGTNFKGNDHSHNTALDELLQSPGKNHRVMLHLFGTSGAAGACKLLRGYRLRTGGLLNVKACVVDTEPSLLCLSSTEPLTSAFFTILLAFWTALQRYMWFFPSELQAGQIHQDLNNPSLLPKEARKCFIFAHRGLMLTWMQRSLPRSKTGEPGSSEVDEEPDERREYAIRRSSIDQKGRWSGDQERYWSGIEGVWEGR